MGFDTKVGVRQLTGLKVGARNVLALMAGEEQVFPPGIESSKQLSHSWDDSTLTLDIWEESQDTAALDYTWYPSAGRLDVITHEIHEYTVNFYNYDGTLLQSGTVTEGEVPVYTGNTPTRPEDDDYTYEFNGWDPAINPVYADQDYYAEYTEHAKQNATELYFTLSSTLTQNLYFTQSAANGVSIDWGDGSAAETIAATSAKATHTYASAGDYVVTMTAADGVTWSPGATITSGSSNTVYGFLGQSTTGKSATYPQLTAITFGTGAYFSSANTRTFHHCTSLVSVEIPNGTTAIGDYCFSGCTSLASVTIPAGVITIGQYAFDGCASLASISIPVGVTTIGLSAFQGCTSLESVDMPTTVTTENGLIFAQCSKLKNIMIPFDMSQIVGPEFWDCVGLEKAWIRASVENIMDGLSVLPFNGCSSSLVIYAEVSERPEKWSPKFHYVNDDTPATVVWNQTTSPF